MSVSSEARARVLQRVNEILDQMDEPETPPENIADELFSSEEAVPDLYSLHAQLAALTREVQLSGRAASRLRTELVEALDRRNVRAPEVDLIIQEIREAKRQTERGILESFLDVRDRFVRGLAESRRRTWRQGLWFFMGQPAEITAMIEGYSMSLGRIDELLSSRGVTEIRALGQPFDPQRMHAVESIGGSDLSGARVVEVIRAGFMVGDRVLRHAEVVVGAESQPRGES